MRLIRWNNKTKEYEPYEVPNDWNVKTYCEDMGAIVNCACCGKRLPFGKCYTSREIHTGLGFGYAVCGDCYFHEESWE